MTEEKIHSKFICGGKKFIQNSFAPGKNSLKIHPKIHATNVGVKSGPEGKNSFLKLHGPRDEFQWRRDFGGFKRAVLVGFSAGPSNFISG